MQRLLQIRSAFMKNLMYLVPNLGILEIHFPMSPLFSPLNTEPTEDLSINILTLIWTVWNCSFHPLSYISSTPKPFPLYCLLLVYESFLIFRSSSFGSLCVEKYNTLWLHGYIPYRCLATHLIAKDLFTILTVRDL